MEVKSDCNSKDKVKERRNNVNLPRTWSQLSYAGESRVPPLDEPTSGTWPTFIIKRNSEGAFIEAGTAANIAGATAMVVNKIFGREEKIESSIN